ncbi:Ammonium transporter [Bathymodiolus thermophilus thioautotrophic gill symbiont]|uniref:Ammonium transporter n=1 Tax=Bathymodiolus thermophilus thioautotrophic gill symbiont TaxID=2360 RepID=A0A1J5TTA0_9GAMM|nr:ammonium transporter [Bathymodiolus thermophilus thioautotrophic gill symbiont]AYQ56170.1 ammonium transporter [Bathymodiolus thermophilus thioautotrophic gill symbiont]OIR24083.1 ammonium transporter [Bathymodiolus thermophilus thioautotrophic gill symbiont]CAB5502380.1 Ammonium transporter [Bathymodiolus thermophilus thioautotrophic gill symbiont]CAB5504496.1 Ammonium transporter [Bathymodiolus thermophilus thioautotrophic gill symbiont]SHA21446.1 Ammonium transporter [Bathymodiolus therm
MENTILEMQFAIDTFYFLVMGALVMWMAAGFSMLEAGLVRSKNTTEILTKNIGLFAIACTTYMIYGYDLMYGGGVLLDGINGQGDTYSNAADFFFQVVFVATAMSIVSGAVAERMKLFSFFAFALVFTAIIYPLEGAWTWGGEAVFGLFKLSDYGFSDFAGSGIVHMAGAAAALAGVILLGARRGKYNKDGSSNAIMGANMPLATLGTFILWMGWFGFNGGSVLAMASKESANAVAMVFLNTNAAAAGGVIAALLLVKILWGKADLTMALNGALAGLVAITAGPDMPSALEATLIGAVGGILVVFSISVLDRVFKIDDPVGAISVHGVVGLWGLLAVPLTNPDVSFTGQLLGAATIFVWVFGASFVLWLAIKTIIGVRVSEQEEAEGVDVSECGLHAYPEFTTK